MSEYWLERTELLLGEEKLERLKSKSVLIVGLGGVGAYAAEMICRAGIGKMTLVDGDTVNITNINRQLPALHSTIGKPKADLIAERLKQINPEIQTFVINDFIEEQQIKELLTQGFDYVVDAIDTLTPKIHLIYHALQNNAKIVSSMGAGGKMDPTLVQIADFKKSYNCNLARFIRKRLRKLGINEGFPVVFSPEDVDKKAVVFTPTEQYKKSNVGTISYMPALFGIQCASKVIRDLVEYEL
ncbi:MAG: tRNA threonylcarbamoyladenosine dehydratase [Salinivirgaceae bacterium]|jgi:tRNA A37 threonylcarbamoyladenosine dehydratase|nr:tRNA threonylcarbamoyladenosine dehydratase [Salinivirgaceae bacterium]